MIEEHPAKEKKKFLRVSSQGYLWSDVERQQQMKPMEPIDVRAHKEMKHFKVKMVDMGNACYQNKKVSNLI